MLATAAGAEFALDREPPLRAHLYGLSAREHVLLLVLHHIAGDGWSLGVLLRDVARCYGARRAGEAPGLAPLAVQYADYTLWQQEVLGSESEEGSAISRQLLFWREHLEGLPEQIELPSDRARPAVASHRGGSVGLLLDGELHAGLLRLARSGGASLFMVLQAGLVGLLSRLGGGSDIALGSPIAGRTDSALDDLVGFFVNTLVLRTDVSGAPSMRDLVGRVRTGNLLAYSHQEVPFERLVEVLNPARSLARHPLFQVMLAFQNNAPARFEVPGLAVRFEPVAVGRAKFDLSVSVSERRREDGAPGGIVGEIEYAADLFERGTVEGLAGRLVRLLAGAVAHPDCPIVRLELLGGEERESILAGWNATAREVLPGSLPFLFAAQAGKRPDATAVVFERGRLSYGELDRRSNQLAHHLRGLGVGPETVVGLCLERSLELIVGLLGILKAGGAYLPLDPQYPAQRLAFMLGDAGARVLVTQQRCWIAWLLPMPARAPRWCGWMRMRRPLPRSPRALRCSRSRRTTPPMSSTPRAQPECRREWWSSIKASRIEHSHGMPSMRGSGSTERSLLIVVDRIRQFRGSRSFCRSCMGARVALRSDIAADVSGVSNPTSRRELFVLTVPSLHRIRTRPSLEIGRRKVWRRSLLAGELCPPKLAIQHARGLLA